MPKVIQYEPDQVGSPVVRQPRATSSGVDFSPIAQGLSDLGQSVEGVIDRIDTTAAEEAAVKFERDKNNIFFNPDNGYFNTQGRNAYDRAAATGQAVADLKKQYGKDLSEGARKKFDSVADQHITRAQTDIFRHSAKGLKVWEISTIEAQVENSIENASLYWNQSDKLRVQRIMGEEAIYDSAKLTGISPEATAEKVQTFRSQFAIGAVDAAIQSSSADGKDALDKYGDLLEGPQKVKADRAIEAKKKAEKTQFDAQQATLTATRLVSDYDSRSEIIDEVNQIDDPELRKKTMYEANRLYSQKRQAEAEERGDAFEAAESVVLNGGSAMTFQASNPDAWEKLSARQQASLAAGKAVVTDPVMLSDLILLPKDELAKINPPDYYHKLEKADRNKLINAVKSAKGQATKKQSVDAQAGRTRVSQTNLAVEQVFGKRSKWDKGKVKQVNAFYALLDSEVSFRESEKGGNLTSEEYTNLLAGLTREVVQEKSSFFWIPTSFDTIAGIPLHKSKESRSLLDVPVEDMGRLSEIMRESGITVTSENLIEVPIIIEHLRENNIPVTSDNLLKAYQQANK